MTDEDLKALKALEAKATPRPWEVDHINNPGEYGSGDDTHAGFYSYAIYSNGKALLDTSNSEVAMVHVEPDEFGETAWDEQGCCDLVFIASARNALPYLISDLEAARGEVERLRAALSYIDSETIAAIAGEPKPQGYDSHDAVPNGLRTHAHIKLSMIREAARQALEVKK